MIHLADLRERELPEVSRNDFESAVRAGWQRPDVGVEGGEPNSVAQARALRALRHMLLRPAETIVAATHDEMISRAGVRVLRVRAGRFFDPEGGGE